MNAVGRKTIAAAPKATNELEESERFILWAVRVWAAHHRAGSPLCGGFGRAFQRAGLQGEAALLYGIMEIAFAGAVRALDIRCVRCNQLGSDEGLLLASLSAAQRHDFSDCQNVLASFLAPVAARAAHARLATLGHHLAAAGICLPVRGAELTPQQSQSFARPRCLDPGAALIH